MNKDVAEKWVEALRSGKYEQGTGALRTADNKFCCLGVLCDVLKPDEWQFIPGEHTKYHHGNQNGGATALLLPDIMEIAGLQSDHGAFEANITIPSRKHLQGRSLITLNDRDELSFWEIAIVIEKVWEEL